MNRQEKIETVEDLKAQYASAKAGYLTRFSGLSVASMTDLRRKIHQAGGHYQVIKNTLARIGFVGTPLEEIAKDLKGPVGWAITTKDPVAVAKVLKDFVKDNEKFSYSDGVMEGKRIDSKGIDRLAELPPKEVLLAQLMGIIQGPARQLATVIQAVPRQLVTVIEQIRKKKEESSNG